MLPNETDHVAMYSTVTSSFERSLLVLTRDATAMYSTAQNIFFRTSRIYNTVQYASVFLAKKKATSDTFRQAVKLCSLTTGTLQCWMHLTKYYCMVLIITVYANPSGSSLSGYHSANHWSVWWKITFDPVAWLLSFLTQASRTYLKLITYMGKVFFKIDVALLNKNS